ncbi:MAG: 4-(cytidine 5'-diphospho)-2-C-methyl-D-erythritol kinase [Planctomycetaceae bacterium]|nr:4-(cytidine 5'-diphospho)-2-C-methyl-D-erythritol kinase [Planctomycetaceae bacterium]
MLADSSAGPCSSLNTSQTVCCGAKPLRSQTVCLPCPAKLNIFLEVLRRREDGYHELDTVMLRTQFSDTLTIQQREDDQLSLRFSDATPDHLRTGVPLDGSNLILKAAEKFRERFGVRHGADFILHKQIPPESGLAGGSSNAASTLTGLRDLWYPDAADTVLHEIAATLGSDINFLLSGARAAVCSSRGEIVTPVPLKVKLFFAAVRPNQGNSTGAVFRGVDFTTPRLCSDGVVDCLKTGDIGTLTRRVFNRLTQPASVLNSEMSELMVAIQSILRRPVFMSGSGSTVFVVSEHRSQAVQDLHTIEVRLRRKGWLLEV